MGYEVKIARYRDRIRHLEERNMVIEIEDDDGEDSAVADSRTEVTEGSRLFVQKSGITEDMVVGANDEVVEDVTAKKNVPEDTGEPLSFSVALEELELLDFDNSSQLL